MTPQIELLFVPDSDPSRYVPITAALSGFAWGDEERARGIIGQCPDSIVGCDIVALLDQLTADDAPAQVRFPFATTRTATRGGIDRVVRDKSSSWVIAAAAIDPQYTVDDVLKPEISADEITAALVLA